jgi:raffinose/stachyose/melibiose transport system permease protein
MARASMTRFRQGAGCYVLLAPTFGLLAIFCLVPFVWAFTTSFYHYEVGETSEWAGTANYRELAADPVLLPSFAHMMFLTVFAVLVTVTVPLVIAKLIHSLRSERVRYLYRLAFLVPIVVPYVAVQMIWGATIYNDAGLMNEILRYVGLDSLARGWLSDHHTVLWAVAFIGFPWAGGINILIYYAGLASIPDSVHEAALLDGATGLRKFLLVDVPLVLSQMKMLVILTLIAGIQSFEGLFILTRGGPGFQSTVPGLWMYFNAFSFQRMGYACAIGVLLFLLILMLTLLNLKYFKSSETLQASA